MNARTAQQVKLQLKQKSVTVPDEWLNACIEWILSEYQEAGSSVTQLSHLVYEQWLETDLQQLNSSSFPLNLSKDDKCNLNEKYCVQINSMRDAGVSAYSQLQKLKGTENENEQVSAAPTQTSWEPKASRMLMMCLTDGNQQVFGMEYKPIPQINLNLPPGTKLLLKGNIICRHGVLMLTRDNIEVLGGQVEHLQQLTQIQILAGHLNIEEDENEPNRAEENRHRQVEDSNEESVMMTTAASTEMLDDSLFNDEMDPAILQAMDDPWQDEDDMDLMLSQIPEPIPSPARQPGPYQVPVRQPGPVQSQVRQPGPVHQPGPLQSQLRQPGPVRQPGPIQSPVNQHVSEPLFATNNPSGSGIDLETDSNREVKDLLRVLNWPVFETLHATNNTRHGISNSRYRNDLHFKQAPFTYLSRVEKLLPVTEPLIFRVKAYISTLTGKLEFNSGQYWSLSAKINDGTASVDVDLSDQFLTELIGYTAQEMCNFRKQASKNPEIKTRISQKLSTKVG
ncbi:recQ-mediated genome instability protein 1-like isoform X2 [Tubulanus polymorphus]|uniref:recQ-mediated genome instability protein 1-like isoform X2 n=1 Tax=Tubulanus polymorphus TaxID=672921 RepID=UPI003DA43252